MYQVPRRTRRDRIPAAAAVLLASVCGVPSRSARRVPFVALVGAAGLLALSASPASAAFSSHTLSTTIAGSGTNALSNPNSVAVDDATGDVYVTDPASHRVEKFDSSGNFLLMFGKSVNSGTGDPNLCTNAGAPTDVCQAGTSTTSPGGFEELVYVVVDNSSGPSAGDVYVGDAEYPAPVSKFDSSGRLITSWGEGGQLKGPPGEEWFTIYGGVAVDKAGNLYVHSYFNMFKFDQAGVWQETSSASAPAEFAGLALDPAKNIIFIDAEGSVEKRTPFPNLTPIGFPASESPGARALAVDPGSGDLYVDSGGTELQHYSSGCSNNCIATESFGSGHLSNARGLAIDPQSGVLYVANPGEHDIAVFTPLIFPDVASGPLQSGPHSLTLNGQVDPAGGPAITECYFEYGTAENTYDLGSAACSPDPGQNPPGSNFAEPTLVHAELSGLEPLISYHYRLVAVSANGATHGADHVALTVPNLPLVDSTTSEAVTADGATLSAEINPGFGSTIYRFQYGESGAYGGRTPPGPSIGSDDTDHLASATISGLGPGVTYHFRVLATNFAGTTFGPDQSFTTPSVPLVSAESASAITTTSAILSAKINPSLSPTTYLVDYGPTAAYGSITPQSQVVGVDGSDHSASVAISGLEPGTVYHYRVVATNAVGVAEGIDQTLTTQPAEAVKPPAITCRHGFVKRHARCLKKKSHKRRHRHA
jgi:hypothetical protein